jgi:flagellar biogenesis protein FliO
MNEKNNIVHDDEEFIRGMMQEARMKAPENLKYRIMHQIETENALKPQRTPVRLSERKVLKDFVGIFGLMYAVLAALIGGAYLLKGKEFALSSGFLWTVILVAFVFSFFWLMTRVDERLNDKRKGNQIHSK